MIKPFCLILIRLKIHMFKGTALYTLRKFDEALVCFDTAIALDSNDPHHHHKKGLTLYEMGKFPEAISSYDKVISLKPNEAYSYFSKGLALAHQKTEFLKAREAFDQALKLSPGNSHIKKNVAISIEKFQALENQ